MPLWRVETEHNSGEARPSDAKVNRRQRGLMKWCQIRHISRCRSLEPIKVEIFGTFSKYTIAANGCQVRDILIESQNIQDGILLMGRRRFGPRS